jgi:ABC transporter DrrB family efflux protein
MLKDPMSLLLSLGIPLVIGVLITAATGGSGGSAPKALLWVVDEDDSVLSKLLVGAFEQNTGAPIEAQPVEREAGRRKLLDGRGSAMLIIPEGFGEALLEDGPTELRLVTNPVQSILPGIIEESLEILVDASFYVHRLFGDEIRTIADGIAADGHPGNVDFMTVSNSIQAAFEHIGEYVSPPLIELETTIVETKDEGSGGGRASFSLYFLPGIALMALMFMAQSHSEDVWREREQGTLRRVASAPAKLVSFLAGKLAASAAIIAAVSLAGLGIAFAYHGLPVRHLPLAVVWSALVGVVLVLGMMAGQLCASSRRAGSIVTNSVMFPLLMAGGSFFPSEVMPKWMARVGRFTPNGYAVERLKDIVLGRHELGSLFVATGVLLATGTILMWFCNWRLGRFARG